MYCKSPKGWIKHLDFSILEIICFQISFFAAFCIRNGFQWKEEDKTAYLFVSLMILFLDILVIFFTEAFKDVLTRGFYKEFAATLKNVFIVIAVLSLVLFLSKRGITISRIVIVLTASIQLIFSYVVRILYKIWLKHILRNRKDISILIISPRARAQRVVEILQKESFRRYHIIGLVLSDENERTDEEIAGIPVVSSLEDCPWFVCREWVDEVFVIADSNKPPVSRTDFADSGEKSENALNDTEYDVFDRLMETGVTMHFSAEGLPYIAEKTYIVEKIAGYTVFTTSISYATVGQIFLKRVIDISAGLVGSVITILLTFIVGPLIFIASPGKIFFAQPRIGKNGKKFRIIKFRTMYPDAEERKKAYRDANKNADGMMFKMDFDPRVIGNKITEDGRKKTGIGQFLRKHSIDEFPQFFNVLAGQMSLVGTRPPTEDEWERYKLRHRARLAIKPGITGLWQVSGRNDISDFDEVVRLDTEYITNWSMGMEFRIILKTIGVIFKGNGV